MRYLVHYLRCDDGTWNAMVPDLPGIVVAGSTREEAEMLVREAIPLHLDAMRAVGEPVPGPTVIDIQFLDVA